MDKDTLNNEDLQDNSQKNADEIKIDNDMAIAMLEKLAQETQDLKDKNLRLVAEMDNLRKRYEKQILDTSKYAVANFAKDLMSVMDNLHRALDFQVSNVEESTEIKNIITGVSMTLDELMNVFKKYDIIRLVPQIGDMFDYNLHQAVSYTETNELKEGSVVNLMQAGYMINDRLLRPAMVVVAKSKLDTDA